MMNKAERQSFNQMKFHIGFLHKRLDDARLKGFADTKIIEQQKKTIKKLKNELKMLKMKRMKKMSMKKKAMKAMKAMKAK